MTITLTKEESEKVFYDALCAMAGTAFRASGYIVETGGKKEYDAAKSRLLESHADEEICIEDVWMEALRGGKGLTYHDQEGDGDYTRMISIHEVHERVQKVDSIWLIPMVHDNDWDVDNADHVLQTVFLNEVVFG